MTTDLGSRVVGSGSLVSRSTGILLDISNKSVCWCSTHHTSQHKLLLKNNRRPTNNNIDCNRYYNYSMILIHYHYKFVDTICPRIMIRPAGWGRKVWGSSWWWRWWWRGSVNISDESRWELSCKLTAGGRQGGRAARPGLCRHTSRSGQQFEGTKKPRRVTATHHYSLLSC